VLVLLLLLPCDVCWSWCVEVDVVAVAGAVAGDAVAVVPAVVVGVVRVLVARELTCAYV